MPWFSQLPPFPAKKIPLNASCEEVIAAIREELLSADRNIKHTSMLEFPSGTDVCKDEIIQICIGIAYWDAMLIQGYNMTFHTTLHGDFTYEDYSEGKYWAIMDGAIGTAAWIDDNEIRFFNLCLETDGKFPELICTVRSCSCAVFGKYHSTRNPLQPNISRYVAMLCNDKHCADKTKYFPTIPQDIASKIAILADDWYDLRTSLSLRSFDEMVSMLY
jgi:hypothetical protein